MAEVRGFRGLRFALDRVGSLDRVVTPPWDVITPEERRNLMGSSPYNMAHLLLPDDGDGMSRYEKAAGDLEDWIARGVLRQDPEDSLYLLEQRFQGLDGTRRVRRGFLGVSKLPEPGDNVILGHERTFVAAFEDRLRLTAATRANLGAILVLYSDPERVVERILNPLHEREPTATGRTIDGATQRLWRVPADALVTEFFRDKKLYIADGHHRFETARAYRDTMRQEASGTALQPYDYVLMGFVSFEDPGLLIYPPHRLVETPDGFQVAPFLAALESWFEVTPVDAKLGERVEAASGCAIGVAIHGAGRFLLTLRDIDRTKLLGDDRKPPWRELDVAVLHRGIIERLLGLDERTPLVYERFADRAIEAVARGEKALAFILKAVRPGQLRACAEAGEPMPPKSTYFFPKLPSGLVIYRLV